MSFEDDDVDFSGPTQGLAAVPFGSSIASSMPATMVSSPPVAAQMSNRNINTNNNTAAILAQAKPMIAVAVDGFKFVGDQYQPQGKVGLSLLGISATHQYVLIMYQQGQRGEKVPLTLTSVTDKFKFIIRADNYGSFYDDSGCNWAARFDSSEALASFCLQLVVARTVSNLKQTLVIQDVLLGDSNGETVADGWRLECNYTTYSLNSESGDLSQTGSVNKQKLKAVVSKGGLSQLVVGIGTHKGRRLGAQMQSNGHFTVYDITVLRAKPPSSSSSVAPSVASESATSAEVLDSSGGSGRVGLLSRMARLGQHVMPGHESAVPGEEAEEYSDSESVTVPSSSPLKPSRNVRQGQAEMPQNARLPSAGVVPGVTMMVGQTGVPIPTLMPQAAKQVAVYQSQTATNQHPEPAPSPALSTDVAGQRPEWSVLFMETRQNSTEMRISLSKIQDKIDALSQKVESQQHHQVHQPNAAALEVAGGVLDGRAVMSALQRMVTEEERLRDELKARQDKIGQLNSRVSELLSDKQTLIEQSNRVLSDRSDALSTSAAQSAGRVLHLEEEKANLALRVSTLTAEVGDLHLAVAEKRRIELDLRNELLAMKETVTLANKNAEDSTAAMKQMEQDTSVAKEAEALAVKELSTEKQHNSLVSAELEQVKKRLEIAHSALSEKDVSLTDALSKASEDQASSAVRVRSLEDEVARLRQDIQVARSNTERLGDQLRTKIGDNEEIAVDRDRIFTELQAKAAEIDELKSKVEAQGRQLEEAQRIRSQASSMRDDYEARLAELQQRFAQQQERYKSLSTTSPPPEDVAVVVSQQVKAIMNQVYQSARSTIGNDEQYYGSEVLKVLLGVIKQTTLSTLGTNKSAPTSRPPPTSTVSESVQKSETAVNQSNENASGDGAFAAVATADGDDKQRSEGESEPSALPDQAVSSEKEDKEEDEEESSSMLDQSEESDDEDLAELSHQAVEDSMSERELGENDNKSDSVIIVVNDEAKGGDRDTPDSLNTEETPLDLPKEVAPVYVTSDEATEETVIEAVHRDPVVPSDSLGQPLETSDNDDNEEDMTEKTADSLSVNVEKEKEPLMEAQESVEQIDSDNEEDEEDKEEPNVVEEVEKQPEFVVTNETERVANDDSSEALEAPEIVKDEGIDDDSSPPLTTSQQDTDVSQEGQTPVPEPSLGQKTTKPTSSLFGDDDSDSDLEGMFSSKPPPAPAPTTTTAERGDDADDQKNSDSIYGQATLQEDETSEEEAITKRPQPPPIPATRGGGLFGDDDDDDDDWFAS